MAEAKRVKPEEARRKVQAGEALLVCAYDDEEKCERARLEGAMTFGEFSTKLPEIGKEREIIFYCK
ncbi:ArsR family transcriptional regulator [Geomonas sp. RF6]|uniref:rhodanese-like domain-containing protein n=1 Tax=Geomonas sp. RF6 TaxID=2897342 RepID=UPI001E63BA51|nr:ArsR family transcriptional regulator [Geomonas sp. RF6]UFS70126.1 ArsR family transcriptional regulator [Geomonas sp. RF6]